MGVAVVEGGTDRLKEGCGMCEWRNQIETRGGV